MPLPRFPIPALLLLLAVLPPAQAGRAHEHGVARLDVATGPGGVNLVFETPLDSLVGFERAPRNDAERQRVEAALARLRAVAGWVRVDPAAGCAAPTVELAAPVLGLGAPSAAPGGEHAELTASVDHRCTKGGQAGFVELSLFEAFPRLQRIEVQAVTPRGQMKLVLRRPDGRVALVR